MKPNWKNQRMAGDQQYLRMSQAYSDWLEAARVYRSLRNATPEQLREADERMEEAWAKYLLIRG